MRTLGSHSWSHYRSTKHPKVPSQLSTHRQQLFSHQKSGLFFGGNKTRSFWVKYSREVEDMSTFQTCGLSELTHPECPGQSSPLHQQLLPSVMARPSPAQQSENSSTNLTSSRKTTILLLKSLPGDQINTKQSARSTSSIP